ncbi:MAG: terminase [Rhizobiaceae bacterium MnEN-MB40S]|nr:MAG: terminase [Rhizobiaceae bacterium MnEN-MB40S]
MAKSTFPEWVFDNSPIDDPFGYGARAVKFIRFLKHPASTAPGHAFQLYDWQERIVRRIHGPRHQDGRRIVETVFMMLPRGSRKTSLAAALSLLHTIGFERVRGGQALFAANDREQAGIGFKEAANIIRMDKRLTSATKIYDAFNSAKKIVHKADGAELQAISSDGRSQHGKTPSFVFVDEIHVWQGRDLWEALKSAMVKVSNTLMIIATTAGRGSENLGFEQYDYARRVALGEIDNPAFLPIIFEAGPDDDWQDETLWHRVNPGLKDGFPNLNALRTAAKEAEHRPAERAAFQQFNLNLWQAHSRNPLFDMAVYDAGKVELDLSDMEELPCYLGVDLSRSGDLTAVVAAWLHDDGRVTVYPWFFLPGDDLKGRSERDGVPYEQWRDEGLVQVIEGPVIEPEIVEDHIREQCARFNVREIVFDPYDAGRMMQHLHDDGLPAVEMRQNITTMGPAIADLERVVNGHAIRHDGHPVLRHHFDTVVVSYNDTGLPRLHKGRQVDRIDGAIAAAMAISRSVTSDSAPSIHERDPDEYAAAMDAAWGE